MSDAPAFKIWQGDCREVMDAWKEGFFHTCITSPPYFGLRLSDPFSRDVLPAVNPVMTGIAEGHDVCGIVSKFPIASPLPYVVGAQGSISGMSCATATAKIIVSLVYVANELFPSRACIKRLTFWRTSINVAWAKSSISPIHSISVPSQVRLWYRGFFAQYLARLIRMVSPLKGVISTRRFHVAVRASEIHSARACRDTEIAKFFVDALWVSAYHFPDVVRGKSLVNVSRAEPISVKMWGFHISILPPSMEVL